MNRHEIDRTVRSRTGGVSGPWLFVGLVMIVISFPVYAWYASENMPNEDIADQITRADGRYQRDSIAPLLCVLADGWVMEYGPIIYVTHRAPLTEEKVAQLAELRHLEELTVIHSAVGPEVATPPRTEPRVWKGLARLTKLEELTLINTDIRDADLIHLDELPRLRRIDLWDNPNVSGAAADLLRRAKPGTHINFRKPENETGELGN